MNTRILLVEDHPATADVVKTELEFFGYEVRHARDGAEALEIALSEPPDLIVLDMRMPKASGFQVATALRQNPKTQKIPILAATALATPGDRERCLAAGCDGYIAKPFLYRELGAAIEKLLKAGRADDPANQSAAKATDC